MSAMINLISTRLIELDFTHPWAYVDLFLASFFIIGFLYYLRKFPAFRVVIGVVFLLACTAFFFFIRLTLTALVFGIVSNLILISLPLIFAPEIRHYLEKLGRFSFIRMPKLTDKQHKDDFIVNLVGAVYELAERKIGGTIVISRKTGLAETIETGVVLDAKFGSKLLQAIFSPKSPLHDGAVIVSADRIVAARCLLPIHAEVNLDSPFGTRHKSGLAITQDTDALAIIISEQRGEVSLAENGKLDIDIQRSKLIDKLHKLLS